MDPLLITALMFSSVLLLMLSGLPVAFILGSVGIVYALCLWGPQALNITYFSTMDTMNSYILAAVPLFIFMGLVLQDSGVADDLFVAAVAPTEIVPSRRHEPRGPLNLPQQRQPIEPLTSMLVRHPAAGWPHEAPSLTTHSEQSSTRNRKYIE